jgi:hypothetical protein
LRDNEPAPYRWRGSIKKGVEEPMKRTSMLLVVLANMCAVAFASRATAADDRACSNATLQGNYGFRQQGTVFTTGLQGGVGVAIFDGNGKAFLSGTFVNQTNGVNRTTGTATYIVNADCTGSTVADNNPSNTQDFVILDSGNEIFEVATRTDRGVATVFKRQFPCHDDRERNASK